MFLILQKSKLLHLSFHQLIVINRLAKNRNRNITNSLVGASRVCLPCHVCAPLPLCNNVHNAFGPSHIFLKPS